MVVPGLEPRSTQGSVYLHTPSPALEEGCKCYLGQRVGKDRGSHLPSTRKEGRGQGGRGGRGHGMDFLLQKYLDLGFFSDRRRVTCSFLPSTAASPWEGHGLGNDSIAHSRHTINAGLI